MIRTAIGLACLCVAVLLLRLWEWLLSTRKGAIAAAIIAFAIYLAATTIITWLFLRDR